MEVNYIYNESKNGIELHFDDKPSEQIREQLKGNGFRWSRQGFWYAKFNNTREQLAQELSNNSKPETKQEEVSSSYPEIDINDIRVYTISQSLQDREHDSNWIMRKEKRDHNKEIQEYYQELNDKVTELLKQTDNEKIIYHLKKSLQYFKKHYFNNYVKRLENKANNPSWIVTGAAGRNRRKDEKMNSRYDNLMREMIDLSNKWEKRYNKAITQIRKDKEEKVKHKVNNTTIDIQFKAHKKEFEYMGIKENKRVYSYGDYFICKLWNMFRVFYKGQEIKTTLKTTSKLNEAKQYVSMLVQQEQEKKAI